MAKNPPADTEDTVQSLIQEDPTGQRATKRMYHNYGACGLEPQPLHPGAPRARAPQEKPPQCRVALLSASRKNPSTVKNK